MSLTDAKPFVRQLGWQQSSTARDKLPPDTAAFVHPWAQTEVTHTYLLIDSAVASARTRTLVVTNLRRLPAILVSILGLPASLPALGAAGASVSAHPHTLMRVQFSQTKHVYDIGLQANAKADSSLNTIWMVCDTRWGGQYRQHGRNCENLSTEACATLALDLCNVQCRGKQTVTLFGFQQYI